MHIHACASAGPNAELIGESKAYVLVLSCERRRHQFSQMCRGSGYQPDAEETDGGLYSFDFGDIGFDIDEDTGKKIVLGQGSFATVYLGYNKATCEQFAVKKLNPEFAGRLGMVTMFSNEAKMLREFHHDNIIEFKGAAEDCDATPIDKYVLWVGES
jgi:hypothetical protein